VKHPFEYQKPTEQQVEQIKVVWEACKALHDVLMEALPHCRERSLAITKLQEVSMWANCGIVMQEEE
jgi:hypothetical protein